MITIVEPDTDLEPFVGKRVRIQRTVNGRRYAYTGVFESLWHQPQYGDAGGMLAEDGAGMTGFSLPYHDAEIEVIS